ncbi:4'-phosphopantetheinyl transferase family protein [Paramylibacter ulvae]|uniref:4'-phosphopantetheinyl transferase family protein n=1 Tax=Paramylibacter ulvae TaxID=1651968 RepID=UPI001675656D|nr:4'-phosphopantetheinyl transferase superfamily protein [Amylibacter ulvae]
MQRLAPLQTITHGNGVRALVFDLDAYKSDAAIYDGAFAMLDKTETARANRFHFDRHRDRFVIGRAILRQHIGAITGDAPQSVVFDYGENDKPALRGGGVEFNLSHSKHAAVLAISETAPIGVDVELLDRRVKPAELARNVFTQSECDVLDQLDESAQRQCFFDFWTAKEAAMKLTGQGMSLPPKSISLLLENQRPTGAHLAQGDVTFNYLAIDAFDCQCCVAQFD